MDGRGILIALFFALTFTAGHLNQEVRDHEGDRATGHRTNAVAFGPVSAFIAGLGVFTLAYADLSLLAWMGLVPALLGWVPPLRGDRSRDAGGDCATLTQSVARRALALLLLFCALVAVYLANGRALGSGDTLPNRHLPWALLRDRTFYLDA